MNATPRSDVGGGGLTGALTVLIMLALQGEVFDFQAVEAAIAVVLTFGGGYLATQYKSLVVAVTAPLASLATSVIAFAVFDQPLNKSLVSTGIATLAVAAVTYLGQPRNPDVPIPPRA